MVKYKAKLTDLDGEVHETEDVAETASRALQLAGMDLIRMHEESGKLGWESVSVEVEPEPLLITAWKEHSQ